MTRSLAAVLMSRSRCEDDAKTRLYRYVTYGYVTRHDHAHCVDVCRRRWP